MRSNRRAYADLRSSFTGESRVAARAGTARDGSPGLDHCTARQRRLRAILALGLFNDHDWAFAEYGWGCPSVTRYNVTFSPRYDALVIISNTPVNVASRMVAARPGSLRVPGLRYDPAKEFSSETRHVIDVESGAELIVTERPSGRQKPLPAGSPAPRRSRLESHGLAHALTAAEQEALAAIPAMTDEIETLLAGLAVRLNARDPLGRWAMGYWFWDPLERPVRDSSMFRVERRLHGEESVWELRWSSYPYVRDVAAMLTHPVIGVAGCGAVEVEDGYDIHLDGSVLALRSWHPVGHLRCNLQAALDLEGIDGPDSRGSNEVSGGPSRRRSASSGGAAPTIL
ncbi:hypothetical protein KDK95_05665 [Actinospica sp. MGRD01-02]|uniref:Uncharacterized protein n=1 Tax=Actinospica acidithermotolerans TaxID=2828514 RepID=A0A941E8L2_9ACTN|nr:hypothetical protein [Actinospica acidithermotolerans]MBR7825787.1 hypothetical protein [Actinospica acidithermotolerans]